MLSQCDFLDVAGFTMQRLNTGVLLVSRAPDGRPNVMAISWGYIGFQWNKPIFVVPVRKTRFSHGLIAARKEFVVCVQPESMDDAMEFCGTKSGREVDKLAALGLGTMSVPGVETPAVAGSAVAYACRVIHTAESEPRSNHTLFFGEILGVFEGK